MIEKIIAFVVSLIGMILLIVFFIAYETGNDVLGWVVATAFVLFIIIGRLLIRFPSLRNKLTGIFRSSSRNIYPKEQQIDNTRIAVPSQIKTQLFRRANHRCENPSCTQTLCLEIHHINKDHCDNSPENLIVLCPTCHALADNASFRKAQIQTWISSNNTMT